VAAERDGFATSKKGLTLLELKNRTGHPNAKVRKGTFFGCVLMFLVDENMKPATL